MSTGKPLDPVTFEVLKNAFISLVDQMAEQILRTCHSFVIYNRDMSSALCDAEGNTVSQGNHDIAVHVGTLHHTCKAVIEAFSDDIHHGDVFVTNDPYLGGTHFSDVRVIRPVFYEDGIIAFTQSNGHWADVGGRVPGSFDVRAREHFGEGLRITPVRIWDRGRYLGDVARLIVSNTRTPDDAEGDLVAQAEATRVGERELLRLVERYGKETVLEAFAEVQDYVERFTRQRLASLPDGVWETEDYLDRDPTGAEDGLIPIKIRMTIEGDSIHFDFSGSHSTIGSIMNSAFGGTFSGIVVGLKTFFPDIPLNSGFYRPISYYAPEDSVVNASWPIAVSGFPMTFEKIMNGIIEMWSEIAPERAMACSFNLEYLEIGGHDGRRPGRPKFMYYDWMAGGWGGRNGKDGSTHTAVFGVGLLTQPVEGQERLCPAVVTQFELLEDSGGPGRYRGGLGVGKGAVMTAVDKSVASYLGDRERAITWGIQGGLPSIPQGVKLEREGRIEHLGVMFADVPLHPGDRFWRPSPGGGGFGDPLDRDVDAVLVDVTHGYVSIERAAKDYGVVVEEVSRNLADYRVDIPRTAQMREQIRTSRIAWLSEDPESVAERYRAGDLDQLDLIRQFGVILDWGTGELLPETTKTYRALLRRKAVPHWEREAVGVVNQS